MVLFRAKKSDLPALYLFILMKTRTFSQLIEEHMSGSAQPQLPIRDIKKMRIINPPKAILNEFVKEAKPVHDKFIFNENHMRTLSRLRDTLLPKLMSGEVRVKL
jgi:type I restriction enzyme S subunit